MLLFLVMSVLFVAFLLLRYRNRAIFCTDRNELTGPKGFPLIGNLYEIGFNVDHLLEIDVDWRLRYGSRNSWTIPFIRATDISHPSHIEYVQKTNFDNYVKGNVTARVMADILGKGIFATDGELWNIQRKTTSHIFTANSFRGIITTSIQSHVEELVQYLKERRGESVPLNEIFYKLTLDTFAKMAFGKDIGSLRDKEPVPFAVAFDFSQSQMNWRALNPQWPIVELFTAKGRKMRESKRIIDEFAYSIIEEREKDESQHEKDLLSLYLAMRDENGEKLPKKQIRDAVLNLIIAGRDTTAQALSWSFFHLLMNPHIYQKAKKEIQTVLGGEKVDYSNYRSLIYVNAVFHEAIRLHPSVPKNAKEALNDDQIPGGPFIKKGEWVRWCDWSMARNPEVWGEDCAVFKPERWIDQDGKFKRVDQWKFHSFNGGPRLCLGQNLATFESVSTMTELIKNFELKFDDGWLESSKMVGGYGWEEKTPMYASSLTLPMKNSMMVKIL
eukprot:TRINITY_DN1236_c0_g1_i1.p1 TRINITY_DN1236_c0_g1~~TRINITY_DN1236_c0_g1_i1.p1  ORF type:complete len:499 (+),score=107.05 TRINITY_DN1236_c0_g1_i1:54-1550(+)